MALIIYKANLKTVEFLILLVGCALLLGGIATFPNYEP
jgi:hypothetical protein